MNKVLNLKRGAIGNNPCHLCNELHVPQNQCRNDALARRVQVLLDANRAIPSILEANKEATMLAGQFQMMLKQAGESHDIISQVCAEHGEIGQQIYQTYMERLDAWAKNFTDQITPLEEKDTESLTSSETSDKNSTQQENGEASPLILSP